MQERKFFIDEQCFGPYRFGHHQHILSEKENGLEMRDIVSFKLPFGWPGNFLGGWFVKRQLKKILTFRILQMRQIFPGSQG